jgi:hypothetical protein
MDGKVECSICGKVMPNHTCWIRHLKAHTEKRLRDAEVGRIPSTKRVKDVRNHFARMLLRNGPKEKGIDL